MAPAIRFRRAVALLGAFPVLAGVDLDVAIGEIVLLEGPNGAGKTSLLRACAGLLPVISGSAEVLGLDLVSERRAARRHVGLLGHATSLYDDLTVEDNVRFATRAWRGSAEAVDGALEALSLTGRLASTLVGRLSAGQRRRTALAALVARDPALWLLDEPHAGLDSEHRDLLDRLVRDAAGRGATVVLASHEHERASALAGRTVSMAGGQVVASARPCPARAATAEVFDGAGERPARAAAAEVVDGAGERPARAAAAEVVDGAGERPARAVAASADGAAQPPATRATTFPRAPANVA